MSSSQKQIGLLVIGKLLALIFTIALPIFLTRILSKDEFGLYSQALVIIIFIPSFFSLGMESSLYYFYPKANNEDRSTYIFQAFSSLIFLSLVASIILLIPNARQLLIGGGPINEFVPNILLLTITMTPAIIIVPLYILKKDYKMSVLYPPFEIILRASLLILFTITLKNGVDSTLKALNVSSIAIFLIITFYTFKEIGHIKIKSLINKSLFLKQVSYSLPFGFANSIKTLSTMADKIICLTYLTTTEYANYAIAFYGIPGIMQIYDSMSQVSVVRMTENFQNGNKKEALRIYNQLVIKTFSFSIPIIAIISIYAKKIIIFLFTEKYIDSTNLFVAYLTTFIIVLLGAGLILRASGETKFTFRAYLLSAVITIPSTILLIKNIGIWGAMIGAIFSIALPKIFMLYKEIQVAESKLKYFLPWFSILKIALISFLCLVPFYILENFIHSFNIYCSGIFAILYLIIVFYIQLKNNLFLLNRDQINSKLHSLRIRLNIS